MDAGGGDGAGGRRLTLADVARAAGVSRSTASRVINDQSRVAPEVRDRVLRVVAALGYRPDGAARALASGRGFTPERAGQLHLVILNECGEPFGASTFYGRVADGVLAALAGTDTRLALHFVTADEIGRVLDDVASARGAGALLVNVAAPLADEFHRRVRRVVSFGRFAPHVPYSEARNEEGAGEAVGHLIASGRRVIAAVDGPATNPCAADRHSGYVSAMTAAGLRPMWTTGGFRREGGYDATLRLLAAHPDLDAVVAACDCTAAGVIQALVAAGRRVPDDVAVTGFDDSVLATYTNPPLTSVRQPVEAMAEQAARDLLHGRVSDGWHQSFPVTLSVRASSAARAA